MQHPDEGMIHTWLDGELSPEDSAAFQEHIATCKQCADAVAEARGLVAASSRIVSALDIVPAGVIPIAKPRQKAWYSSAQFRAAAAVLVVAGASLLVFRNENQNGATVMQRAASTAEKKATPDVAPIAAPTASALATEAPAAKGQPKSVGAVANSAVPAPAPMVAPERAHVSAPVAAVADAMARKDAITRTKEQDFSGKGVKGGTAFGVAGSGAAQSQSAGFAKAAEEPKANDALQGRVAGIADASRMASAVNPVVVTGVATAAAEPEARLIRVDSAKMPRQSIYETPSGARLTLTEIESPSFATIAKESASTTGDGKAAARLRKPPSVVATVSPPTTPVVTDPMIAVPTGITEKASAKPTINTITWFDGTGLRRYVLSGPVSVAQLEAVKAQIQRKNQ